MDARCIDRPAAVVVGIRSTLTDAVVAELTSRGYDVHVSSALAPWAQDAPHPRLRVVPGDQTVSARDLVDAVRDRGAPLAVAVCAHGADVALLHELLVEHMRPLRAATLIVLGGVDTDRAGLPRAARGPHPTRRVATSGAPRTSPGVRVVTVSPRPAPRWPHRAGPTIRHQLDLLLAG